MKTSKLTGADIDYWVAKAAGYEAEFSSEMIPPVVAMIRRSPQAGYEVFAPSTNWLVGGPIIERERITVQASQAGDWRAYLGDGTTNAGTVRRHSDPLIQERGDTPLIAAMRAFVASKFGEEVNA